jgi:PIN domain nuclease of toxin-antitoxin system
MKLLLDTHTFLWFIEGDARLSARARRLIEDPGNEIYLSAASLWKMGIKASLGKLQLQRPFAMLIPQEIADNQIMLLDITCDHVVAITTLPFHHRDPFDRMLIAQSLVEQIPIVSADAVLDAYSVTRLW